MVPVHSRLSFYAVSGGGGGIFASPLVTGGAHPLLSTYTTTHGVFVYGGGADVRLERRLSLRADGQGFSDGQGTERDGRQTPRVAAVRRGVSFFRPGPGRSTPKGEVRKMPPTNLN